MFVDGYSTHLTYQTSQLCSRLGIILIALYPNETRMVQPVDVSAFKHLKVNYDKAVQRLHSYYPRTVRKLCSHTFRIETLVGEEEIDLFHNFYLGNLPIHEVEMLFYFYNIFKNKRNNEETSNKIQEILSIEQGIDIEDIPRILVEGLKGEIDAGKEEDETAPYVATQCQDIQEEEMSTIDMNEDSKEKSFKYKSPYFEKEGESTSAGK
ncbi:hypothetical protein HHI36_000720 [Cryptolaemus montrouzieri]|uniref:DDE-1 domain-containing protein n=1 Tax=Cryptolaemus montrouzieri TaxID=559131 RepID=A0ABD2P5W7_9CUCU